MQYLNDFLQAWNDFHRLPYADTLIVAAGALLTLFAVLRIVRSSVTMLFWVALAGFGLVAVLHGTGRAPWEPRTSDIELDDLVGPGKEVPRDVLAYLCDRLEEVRGRGEYRIEAPAGGTERTGPIRVGRVHLDLDSDARGERCEVRPESIAPPRGS